MTFRLFGGKLTASDAGTRTREYDLLHFGETGHAAIDGKPVTLTASANSLTVPPGPLPVNDEHTARSVAFMTVTKRPEKLTASVAFFDTPDGHKAYAEASDGSKRGISVEVAGPVVDPSSLLTAGLLTGAGIVARPAFPSSVLTAAEVLTPEAEQDLTDAETAVEDALDAPDPAATLDAIQQAQDALAQAADALTPPADTGNLTASKGTPPMPRPALPLPNALRNHVQGVPVAQNDEHSLAKLTAALASSDGERSTLLAAFSKVSQAKNFDIYEQPAWVGEINAKKPYTRRYADLILNNPLTSSKVQGWKFKTTPIVDDYAGNFAEIPSAEVEIEAVEFTAGRVAGGNKVDRIHHDFPDEGFWAAYLRESAADYDRKTDNKVLKNLLDTATPITAGAPVAGVSAGWSKLVDGILSIWTDFAPTFALIGADLYRDMLLTTDKDKLAFLNASLGWEEGDLNSFKFRVIPNAGKLIVGSRDAAELQELPGLIRVSALDVSHAATDEGVYGYNGTWTRDARALVSVTDAPAG